MLGVALAFVSSIFWGASDFAGGVSSRRATALSATLWSFVAATVASAAAIAIFPGTWSGTALVVGAVAGALGVCGFLTLYAALASAPMGVVTVIVGAVEAIVPVVVGVFWYREALSALAWSGIAIALAGAAIIGWAESVTAEGGAGAKAALGPLALAAASGALFGFSVVALDAAPEDSGFITPAFEVAVGLALLGLLVWAVARVRAVRRTSVSRPRRMGARLQRRNCARRNDRRHRRSTSVAQSDRPAGVNRRVFFVLLLLALGAALGPTDPHFLLRRLAGRRGSRSGRWSGGSPRLLLRSLIGRRSGGRVVRGSNAGGARDNDRGGGGGAPGDMDVLNGFHRFDSIFKDVHVANECASTRL